MKITKLKINPKWLPIRINQELLEAAFAAAKKTSNRVLTIIPPTKPCFYKLFSVWQEAKTEGLPHILLHSGQHYDNQIGFGLKEFGYDKALAIDLQIRGDLSQKSAELFSKLKEIALFIEKRWPDSALVPFVSGDTLSAGIIPIAWSFATNQKSFHTEAGLRSMSPEFFLSFDEKKNMDIRLFVEKQFDDKRILNRSEPFPEQIDTFIAESASQYFFTGHKINEKHLIREGYTKENIFTFGNTVVDAISSIKKGGSAESIFSLYPELSRGEWLRVDFHHRGNLTERRLKAIIGSIIDLVKYGKNIVLIELNSTKKALEYYNLRKKLIDLSQNKKNFLFTPLWQKYSQVIEFIESKNCWAIMTDSGSLQEETNEMQKPCLTLRFNTDRPETVMDAHSNILVPPISKEFILKVVNYIYDNSDLRKKMSRSKKIYGEKVAKKIIPKIKDLFKSDAPMFEWAHEELKIYKDKKNQFKYL